MRTRIAALEHSADAEAVTDTRGRFDGDAEDTEMPAYRRRDPQVEHVDGPFIRHIEHLAVGERSPAPRQIEPVSKKSGSVRLIRVPKANPA